MHVPGFRASVPLPPIPGAMQIPIAGAEGWRRIVANLAVVVDYLEQTFVVEMEREAGVAPSWFDPG